MGIRRNLKILIAAAFAVLLISIRPASADDSACKGLATAKPSDLLALPGVISHDLPWLPPGVSCTWEGLDSKPSGCDWQTTIVEDRKVGDDRRLIVASFNFAPADAALDRPRRWHPKSPRRYAFIFSCADGRVKKVFEIEFGPETRILEAGIEKLTLTDIGSPPQPRFPRSFYWRKDWNDYVDYITSPEAVETPTPPQKIPCKDLRAIDKNRLMSMDDPTWHGEGCYSLTGEDPDAPNAEENGVFCDQTVALARDQMIGDSRRLVDVRSIGASAGSGSDAVLIYGCVSGQIRAIFRAGFDLSAIEDASLDRLVLWNTDCAGGSKSGLAGCPTREARLTYLWDDRLGAYLLRSAHFRPMNWSLHREEERLPTVNPGSWGIGQSKRR
ncbi:MAG: hypothetical protein ABSD31_02950 [Candidatus Binataceae bacterium]